MRTKEIQAMIKEGLFKAGSVLSRAEVEKLTRRARPSADLRRKTAKMQAGANLRLVGFQSKVNDELHTKGLHLRSRDYYSEFYVIPRNQTGDVVDSYIAKASNASQNALALSAGRAKRK